MSIEDDIALLDTIPPLHSLGREALRIIAIGAESRIVRGGDILFREGQKADSAFVVVSGMFALTREAALRDRAAASTQPVNVGPGTLLGEMALITETHRPATATATETSSVLRIPRSIFMRTVESFPEAAQRLSADISARLGATVSALQRVRWRLDAIPLREGLPEPSLDLEVYQDPSIAGPPPARAPKSDLAPKPDRGSKPDRGALGKGGEADPDEPPADEEPKAP